MSDREQEREAQAGEYVLGTLAAAERDAFEDALAHDPALQAMVAAWQERLADLVAMVPEQAPDPAAWAALERALERLIERQGGAAAPQQQPEYLSAAAIAASRGPVRRSRARWRAAAVAMAALAAGLALFLGATVRRGQAASYVAIVDRGGSLPALIVEVDPAAGVVHVRALAAETPADRSLQLWYIAPSGGAPRSLGLLDQPRRDAALPAAAGTGDLAGATLAVSVEPPGGSKTSGPSGPVIYSGKLLRR